MRAKGLELLSGRVKALRFAVRLDNFRRAQRLRMGLAAYLRHLEEPFLSPPAKASQAAGRASVATGFGTQLLGIGWRSHRPGGVTKSHKVASFLATGTRCVSPKLRGTAPIVQAFAGPPARLRPQHQPINSQLFD